MLLLECGDAAAGDVAHHGAEELVLGGEVEIDGAFGDAGAARDVVEPGASESALAELDEGGVEDLAGPFFGPALPAWRVGAGGGAAGVLPAVLRGHSPELNDRPVSYQVPPLTNRVLWALVPLEERV